MNKIKITFKCEPYEENYSTLHVKIKQPKYKAFRYMIILKNLNVCPGVIQQEIGEALSLYREHREKK